MLKTRRTAYKQRANNSRRGNYELTRVASNSQMPICLSLMSAEIKGQAYTTRPDNSDNNDAISNNNTFCIIPCKFI